MLHLILRGFYTPAMQNSHRFSPVCVHSVCVHSFPIYKILIILFFLICIGSFPKGFCQSVHSINNLSGNNRNISERDKERVKMILQLPSKNRVALLRNYGSISFVVLRSFVFSNHLPMQQRWHALMSLTHAYPQGAADVVESALQSSVWFLRNAGLIAMESINIERALYWAGELLNDPALVVRTAAVKMIRKHKASQFKYLLVHKLNAEDSFYKDKSLWIRHHIVYALADFSESGEESFFISLLNDEDERLYPPSIIALEKLTQTSFRSTEIGKQRSNDRQKHQWLSWWSQRQKNLSVNSKNNFKDPS